MTEVRHGSTPEKQKKTEIAHSGNLPVEQGGERPSVHFSTLQDLEAALKAGKVENVRFNPETGQYDADIPDTLGEVREPATAIPTDAFVPLTEPSPTETLDKQPQSRKISRRSIILGAVGIGAAVAGGGIIAATRPRQNVVTPPLQPTPSIDPSTPTPTAESPSPSATESEPTKQEAEQKKLEAQAETDASRYNDLRVKAKYFNKLGFDDRTFYASYAYLRVWRGDDESALTVISDPPKEGEKDYTVLPSGTSVADANPINSTTDTDGSSLIITDGAVMMEAETFGRIVMFAQAEGRSAEIGEEKLDKDAARRIESGIVADPRGKLYELNESFIDENETIFRDTTAYKPITVINTKSGLPVTIDGKTYKTVTVDYSRGSHRFLDTKAVVTTSVSGIDPLNTDENNNPLYKEYQVTLFPTIASKSL